ncbi:MAG TPA: Clp protease ClpC, partial [Planctomycetes bacterium]|nr:Clp protease ClpC [Planctomycetota bacterium]
NLLKPALARADLRVIGATTPEEYERHVASDRAFARRFETLWLEEPSRAEAHEILLRLRPSYEEHHGVELELGALEAAIELSQRYLPERRLPDKALDLLDQACARGRLAKLARVGREELADLVAERARVPRHSLLRSESERLEALREFLAGRIVGQDHALDQVAATLRAARAGLRGERRPRASFLCVGPSGTGKTALAKALAEFLFEDEERLVRIDLSECSERHSVARLIGSPAGYVGHGDEGQLTGALRRQPFSVVLFDELEKAHPDVLNLLLQVLDEGRLSDAHGRPASFREAIVVLTSNVGAGRSEALGFGGAGASPAERALAEELRPELLNRLDAVLEFGPLDEDALERVCLLEVGRLRERLLRQGLTGLEVSAEARRELAGRGRDDRYGARALLREVERALTEPLAAALTQSALRPGDAARLELSRGELVLRFDEGADPEVADPGADGADPEAACP